MTYEGLRLKLLKPIRIKLSGVRKKQLKNTDFTIISNNCWGGMIYESYNLKKNSPTVGLFFMASDYIKFISNLEHYLSAELTFINPETARCVEEMKKNNRFPNFPVGLLDGEIEIVFLHYHSEKEALEKWQRRCSRVNFDNIIFKFNDQNGCTLQDLEDFINLPYKNKIFFTCKKWPISSPVIKRIHQPKCYSSITTSHEPFGSSVTQIINNMCKGM